MKTKQNPKQEKFHSFIEIKEKFFPKPTKRTKKIEEEAELVGVHLADEFMENFIKRLSKVKP